VLLGGATHRGTKGATQGADLEADKTTQIQEVMSNKNEEGATHRATYRATQGATNKNNYDITRRDICRKYPVFLCASK